MYLSSTDRQASSCLYVSQTLHPELRDESQHARAKLNASMNESFEHAANDRDVMRREIDDSFKSTHKSLKRLREETNERFQSNAVARTVDLVAALASEKEILERMDNSLNEAYAFEEGKRQEQYAYEEAARNQQYEYDESKRQELRAEVDSALEAAERDRAKIKKTAASNSTAAALARKENQAQVKSRFRSNAVERVLDALCTSVELLETNEVRDAENAHVKRQALALEKRVQTKILDESKQQSDMRFALQEEVDKKLELAEAEREHNRSHLESMIEEEKAATAASLKKQENQMLVELFLWERKTNVIAYSITLYFIVLSKETTFSPTSRAPLLLRPLLTPLSRESSTQGSEWLSMRQTKGLKRRPRIESRLTRLSMIAAWRTMPQFTSSLVESWTMYKRCRNSKGSSLPRATPSSRLTLMPRSWYKTKSSRSTPRNTKTWRLNRATRIRRSRWARRSRIRLTLSRSNRMSQ